MQTILYGYSFPSYLSDKPRVKVGKTTGPHGVEPNLLAEKRILEQGKTAHPEDFVLLFAVVVPGDYVERQVHKFLKECASQVKGKTTGSEWFEFEGNDELDAFVDAIKEVFPPPEITRYSRVGVVSPFAFNRGVTLVECGCGNTHRYPELIEPIENDYGYAVFKCKKGDFVHIVTAKNVDGILYNPEMNTLLEYNCGNPPGFVQGGTLELSL